MPVLALKKFFLGKSGEAVPWTVVIIIGVILAVGIFLALHSGVISGARYIGNALSNFYPSQ